MKLLAIDIGGTYVKTGLVTKEGEVLSTKKFPTLMKDLSSFKNRLVHHLHQYDFNQIDGIAFSCTGLTNQEQLIMGIGNSIEKYFGYTLAADLQALYHLPISVENDGNCALLAEHWLGAAKDMKNVASIVIGTSIGGAVIINHQLYKGSHQLAGEFGYGLIDNGNQWEIWSIIGSTQGLIQQLGGHYSGYDIFEKFKLGDSQVITAVQTFAERIAVNCYNIQYFLDPEVILIGGGISEEPLLFDLVEEKLNSIIEGIPSTVIKPQIKRCHFGNQANLIGAAKHWFNLYT